ncbi:hypothetical protein WG66_012755 [Moniliophthora roreri]|nr:hypothetical protein WG66_012755 [Moniliophthora roreri]
MIDMTRSQRDFDIDPITGFVPSKPLPRLSAEYELWEQALLDGLDNIKLGEDTSDQAIAARPAAERWRSTVSTWPVLSIDKILRNRALACRAHLVLAWLVHLYVHSIPPMAEPEPIKVPACLAVPLVAVSRHLGIAPVLTFADTVLWNWELINPEGPVTIDNMRFLHAFSGTEDEYNFYKVSATVELHGANILRFIDEYNNLPNLRDTTAIFKVACDLRNLTTVIEELASIMQSVRPIVDPHVFYWDMRPWFEGSDAKGPSGHGWIYEGAEQSHKLDLSGPSAGQSTAMHALDVFLDIDHKLRQRRYPAPSEENKRADHGFMQRMRRYMPGKHRQYLEHLEATPRSIRELAQSTPMLREPYNNAVMALKRLRDSHMRIACLYVVTMSHSVPDARSGCPASQMLKRLEESRASGKGPVRGTGGNELSLLLKAGRDATRRAAL